MTHPSHRETDKYPAIRQAPRSDGHFLVWFTTAGKPDERVYEGARSISTRDRSRARKFDEQAAHIEASRWLMIAGISGAGFEPA